MDRMLNHQHMRRMMRAATALLLITMLVALLPPGSTPVYAQAERIPWTNVGPEAVDVTALAIDPRNPSILYAGTRGKYLYKSTNGGTTWQQVTQGLDATLNDLVIDPVDTSTLYAGSNSIGVAKSTDAGITWRPANSIRSGDRQLRNVYSIAIDPRNRSTLYSSSENGVYKSIDGAQTWFPTSAGIPLGTVIRELVIDPQNTAQIYARSLDHIYKSTDGAASWRAIDQGLPQISGGGVSGAERIDLVIDPLRPETLYIATLGTGFYRSTDSGATWARINAPSSSGNTSLTLDPQNPATLYATAVGRNVYRSTDSGATWGSLGEVAGVRRVLVDPRNSYVLYAFGEGGISTLQLPVPNVLVSPPLRRATGGLLGVPPFAIANTTFDLAVTVENADGTFARGFNGSVTLALIGGPEDASLQGTTTVTATNGLARFPALTINRAGSGYRIQATAQGTNAGASQPFDVLQEEQESNDRIQRANLIESLPAAYAGRIALDDDPDWYRIDTGNRAGATVSLTLSNLPADYDLALMRLPQVSGSDGAFLNNVVDASVIEADGTASALGVSDAITRISLLNGQNLSGAVIALSTNRGTTSEQISATLPQAGSYFLLVYSAEGESNALQHYRLDVTLTGGTIAPGPALRAQPVAALNLEADPAVETLYLYHSTRMRQRYPDPGESQATDRLVATLTEAPANNLIGFSNGASLDLSGARGQIPPATLQVLNGLYAAWDTPANRNRVEYANEVAQQIRNILDTAIAQAYPNTTNLVLVGGDAILPFYRVPDEAAFALESSYLKELDSFNRNALDPASPLAGALSRNYYQTDDFYADRAPTPWRGRQLFIPDQAIGRLVEQPSQIERYLSASAQNGYSIAADTAASGTQPAAAAFISGYDFTTDQIDAMSERLQQFGFQRTARPGQNFSLNVLNSNTWTVENLTNLWLRGSAAQHRISSLNGHFTHYALEPADRGSGILTAERLSAQAEGYFNNTLIYSIGCHAGLNVPAAAFPSDSLLQTDFAETILAQGGTWIGSTGYAFGDKSAIGYSERLALLFTDQIGRRIERDTAYRGAPVGESLVQAKQRYLQSTGSGGFSAADEKVLAQMTLYGLPFLRVRVPQPQAPQLDASFAPPVALPDPLQQNSGVITRIITFTNQFEIVDAFNPDSPLLPNGRKLVRTVTQVSDSFTNSSSTITSIDQMAPGRPVLPTLVYDLTLLPNPLRQGAANPEPRGVQLIDADSLPLLEDFRPHVTRAITQETQSNLRIDPELRVLNQWLPDLPYTFQRAPAAEGYADKLLVNPVQFSAVDAESGQLRQFSRMVFVVSYVDPARVTPEVLGCGWNIICHLMGKNKTSGKGPSLNAAVLQQNGQNLTLSTVATYRSSIGMNQVNATYTTDGENWQRVRLRPSAALPTQVPGFTRVEYSVDLPVLPGGTMIEAFVEGFDNAGNVTVATAKGTGLQLPVLHLPTIATTPPAPDLVASVRVAPNRRVFTAGEPMVLTVTITNQGSADAAPFWTDLYINPARVPEAPNIPWNSVCGLQPCFGLTWGVTRGLKAGESITLTSNVGSFAGAYSIWPGWFASGTSDIYVYVDSWNPRGANGAVAERDEANNRAELRGLQVNGPNPNLLLTQSTRAIQQRPTEP